MENKLPDKLTSLRKHFNYSQADLAGKLGTTVQEYMRWENGNQMCRMAHLKKLAEIYDVSLQMLVDNTQDLELPAVEEDLSIPFMNRTTSSYSDYDDEDTDEFDTVQKTYGGSTRMFEVEEDDEDDFKTDGFGKTKVMDASSIQKSARGSKYYDEDDYDDSEEDDYEEEPVRKPKKKTSGKSSSGKTSGKAAPKKNNKNLFIIIGVVAGILILVLGILLFMKLRKPKEEENETPSAATSIQSQLILGEGFSMYLQSNGAVSTMGTAVPSLSTANLVQISSGGMYAAGLRNDGTVISTGSFNTSTWEDITSIAAGSDHIVGVQKDGKVVCAGSNGCNVDGWSNIKSAAAGTGITIGIKEDGSLETCGTISDETRLASVTDAKYVSVGTSQIAVTHKDGTVDCYSIDGSPVTSTNSIANASKAVVGDDFVAALCSTSVVMVSSNTEMETEVAKWSNVADIAAYQDTLVAVSGGQIIGVGDNEKNVYKVIDEEPEEEEETGNRIGQVTNVMFNATSANLSITWTAVEDAKFYEVTVNTDPVTTLKTDKNSASVSSDKLKDGNTYTIMIKTIARDNSELEDSEALTLTYNYSANKAKLSTPTGLKLQQNNKIITANWTAVSSAQKYQVTIGDKTQEVTTTSASQEMTLTADGAVNVTVIAIASGEDSRFTNSDPATGSIQYKAPAVQLATPAITSATPIEGGLEITWGAVANAATYDISITGGGVTVSKSTSETSVQFNNLITGTNYTITVTAKAGTKSYLDSAAASTSAIYTAAKVAVTLLDSTGAQLAIINVDAGQYSDTDLWAWVSEDVKARYDFTDNGEYHTVAANNNKFKLNATVKPEGSESTEEQQG